MKLKQFLFRTKNLIKNEEGAIIIFYAVLIPIIMSFIALAIDLGFAYGRKGGMQAAVDAAAMAGALQIVSDNPSGLTMSSNVYQNIMTNAVNQAYASLNYAGYTNGFKDQFREVTVNPPSVDDTVSPYTVTVSISETRFLNFLAVAERLRGSNYTSTLIGAQAKARAIWKGDSCILALNPTMYGGVIINGSTTIGGADVNPCGITVDSNNACALATQGSSVNIKVPVYAVGGICMTGNPEIPPVSHSYYVPDPYAVSGTKNYLNAFYNNSLSSKAAIAFSGSAIIDGIKTWTLPPPPNQQYYSSNDLRNSIGPQDSVSFTTGAYVFNDGFSLKAGQKIASNNGSASIIVGSGTIKFGSQSAININAPTTGSLAGVAVACILACSSVSLNGGPQFSGSIYAPNASVTYSGNPQSPCVQIIADSVSLSGHATLNDSCIPGPNRLGIYYARLTE